MEALGRGSTVGLGTSVAFHPSSGTAARATQAHPPTTSNNSPLIRQPLPLPLPTSTPQSASQAIPATLSCRQILLPKRSPPTRAFASSVSSHSRALRDPSTPSLPASIERMTARLPSHAGSDSHNVEPGFGGWKGREEDEMIALSALTELMTGGGGDPGRGGGIQSCE